MAYIENITKHPSYPSISARLKRRGLIPMLKEPWEKHGPHGGMEYMVFIGWCIDKGDKGKEKCVAIYPKKIYWISDPGDWWKADHAI